MKLRSNIKVFSLLALQSVIIVLIGLFTINKSMAFSKTATILSMGLVLTCHLLFYVMSNYKIASVVGANFFGLVIAVNYFKVKIRNTPLIISDVKLIDEMANVKNLFSIVEILAVVVGFIVINALLYFVFSQLFKVIKVEKEELRRRLFVAVMIPAALISYYGIRNTAYKYERSGVFYHLTRSITNSASEIDFSKEEKALLEEIADDMVPSADGKDTSTPSDQTEAEEKQPNIVIIMNEAFWDVNLLEQTKLTPDPMAPFYDLQEKGIKGNLQVPVFGGGTSNTEYEVLTGFSTHIYDGGYMLYTNEVTKPYMSLASVLKTQGYSTTGLHSFWGWCYDRNQVYKHLGFDKFIVDEYMNYSSLKGYYISDESTTDEIIDELEETEAPAFIYCVTMQNHGPYDDKRYENIDMDVAIEGDLSEEAMELTQVFGQGVYDATMALDKLVKYLETSEEETIVVFFGDHLPLMGDDLKVYKENDFITEDQSFVENAMKLSTVPFVIWSNYKEDIRDIGLMDTTFLGPFVLDYAGVEMPNYYKHVLKMYEKVDFVSDRMIQDKAGNIYTSESDQYKNLEAPIRIVQKDMLYGNQDLEPDMYQWIDYKNDHYNSDLQVITIESVDIDGSQLKITGKNLYSKGKLYINDIEHTFTFVDSENIVVDNVDTKPESGLLEIKMDLKDTIEQVIASSNEFRKDTNETSTN